MAGWLGLSLAIVVVSLNSLERGDREINTHTVTQTTTISKYLSRAHFESAGQKYHNVFNLRAISKGEKEKIFFGISQLPIQVHIKT